MRKIHRHYENPIDNYFIDLAEYFSTFFYSLNMTPNHLTFLSLIFGILSIYYLYKKSLYLFGIMYIISYWFDVADGYYARKYDMVTDFGDKFDHFKDLVINITIAFLLIYNNYNNPHVFIIVSILLLFIFLSFIHLGCQENIYDPGNIKNESGTLTVLRGFCEDPHDNIHYTKYFGCATYIIIFVLCVIFLEN